MNIAFQMFTDPSAKLTPKQAEARMQELWRHAMLCKLISCGANQNVAARLLDSGIPWMLTPITSQEPSQETGIHANAP